MIDILKKLKREIIKNKCDIKQYIFVLPLSIYTNIKSKIELDEEGNELIIGIYLIKDADVNTIYLMRIEDYIRNGGNKTWTTKKKF
jgi:hypothetical protein